MKGPDKTRGWVVDELECEDYLAQVQIALAPDGRPSVGWASPQGGYPVEFKHRPADPAIVIAVAHTPY